MKKGIFILTTLLFLTSAHAVPLPQYLNFDGQLLNSSDQPITSATTVVFEIYDPSASPFCLLYKETQTITPDTYGEFSTKIGPGAGATASPDDGNIPWATIFQNDSQVRAADATFCPGGYTPASGHTRKLRVTVGGNVLSPDYSLAPVPTATVAETLQGKVPGDFLLSAPTSGIAVLDADLEIQQNQQLKLGDSSNPSANFVSIMAPATFTSYTLTLPTTDGTANQYLQTDGNGVLSWATGAGGGISSLNGQTGATQTFAYATTGTSPSWASATDTHTLSIPLASTASVTAGLISKTDYDNFNSKLSATGGSMTGNLAMGTNLITGLGTPTAATDAATKGYVDGLLTAISGTQITDGSVVAADLAADSVTSAKIVDGTIATADLANASVTDAKIAAVEASKITSTTGYLTYAPNGSVCANGEVLKWNFVTGWDCGTDLGGGSASAITNTAAGNISSTNVQAAINELDTEKLMRAGDSIVGPLTFNTQNQARFADAAGGEYAAIQAPATISANYVLTLPADDGTAGQVMTTDGNGVLSWTTPAAGGETNTASNQGAGGVGVYRQKTGADLEFRNINAASNKVTVALDAGNVEIDIDVNEANFALGSIPNTPAGNIAATSAQAAINELDSEKLSFTGGLMTGVLAMGPIGTGTGQTGQIPFRELAASGSNSLTIRAPDSLAADYVFTLPTDDGVAGQVMTTDGNGNLSWSTPLYSGTTLMVADGTNTAPGLSFSSDPDTGLFRPANDILSFSTGATERLRIDNLGQVGIGTITPSVQLEVKKESSLINNIEIVGRFSHESTATPGSGFGTGIQLAAETTAAPNQTIASIESYWTNPVHGTRTSTLRFFTVDNAALAPKMVITGPGNVGIGVTVPNAKLEIDGPAGPLLDVKSTGVSVLFVNDTGVGIGQTAPNVDLDVNITGVMRLKRQLAATPPPMGCSGSTDGAVAITSTYIMCVCNGTAPGWVRASDGTTACVW